jgi:hypothetical protein
MILIDLSYLWGIKWAKRYSQGSSCYAVLLVIASLFMLGGSGVFLICSFKYHQT